MSGLIWAGVGKGISDAATTFGTSMMRQNEEEARLAREEARDARKLAAEEKKAEDLKKRVISEIAAAQGKAGDIGRDRIAGQVQAIGSQVAGDSPVMEQSEISALLKDNPQYEQIYRQSGIIKDAMDPRAQRATDEVDAALGIGAHSSVIDALTKKRSAVLEEIREENKEKARVAERTEANRRLDQQDRRLDILDKNVTNRTAKDADKPVTEDQITRAESALGMARDRIAKQFREPTMQEKVDPAKMAEYQREKEKFVDSHPDVKRQSDRLENLYSGGRSTAPAQRPGPVKPGNNNNVNSGPGNMPKPQSAAELNKLAPGTRYVAPDGTIRIKS
jgi:hypothetical protein